MREITAHVLNPVNDLLKIHVIDEPGPGGAHHEYHVEEPNGVVHEIAFQNGPINEVGVNGLTHEVLLAIVADRLQSFQAGPFACAANEAALSHVQSAMGCLFDRTRERMNRGVEGTTAA